MQSPWLADPLADPLVDPLNHGLEDPLLDVLADVLAAYRRLQPCFVGSPGLSPSPKSRCLP